MSGLITRAEFDVVFSHWTESKTEHQMDLFYHFYEMGWLDCARLEYEERFRGVSQ